MSMFTDDEYFTGPHLSSDILESAEATLGFSLPSSYLETLADRNGGVPIRQCFPMDTPTSWATDHIKIDAIRGLGGEWGIDSEDGLGSKDLIAEWDYPDIGIVICKTPSGGHDTVMLDYTECGKGGEPRVVYVDDDRSIHLLAPTFADFLDKLVPCSNFKLTD